MEERVENLSEATGSSIGSQPAERRTYQRSSVEFPYNDLDDAVAIVRAIHDNAGAASEIEALAGYMRQTTTSGAFRGRVSNAGTFRLVDYERGTVTLTALGAAALDPEQAPAARADAFLQVPLYRQVFDRFKGGMLPPPAALERTMEELGVAPKQTEKARQAFVRSARQAGFFAHGEDRLVKPQFANTMPASQSIEDRQPSAKTEAITGGGSGDGGGKPPTDPIIRGLINRLPPPDAIWEMAERAKWLQTVTSAFDLIYTAENGGEIKVAFQPGERSG